MNMNSAVFSPDGAKILTGGHSKIATVWNGETFRKMISLSGHEDLVKSAMFSADGGSIVTCSEDCSAKVWNSSTGECTQTLVGHYGCVLSAVFASNPAEYSQAKHDFA